MDEHGIPLALYAANQLLKRDVADRPVWESLRRALPEGQWLSPPALYLLRDLVGGYLERASEGDPRRAAVSLAREIADELARAEQALALKAEFPGLGLIPIDAAPGRWANTWVPYGTSAWLVGAAPAVSGEQGVVVAVSISSPLSRPWRREPLLRARSPARSH